MSAKRYSCTLQTSVSAASAEGEAIPLVTADGRQRVIWGADEAGRGVSVTIQPLDADTQFVLHSVGITVVPTLAGDDEA